MNVKMINKSTSLIIIIILCCPCLLIFSLSFDNQHDELYERAEVNPLGYGNCAKGQFRFDWMRTTKGFGCSSERRNWWQASECAQVGSRKAARQRPRVAGGFNVKEGEYPSFVSIVYDEGGREKYCGGMLLSPFLVITAADCLLTASRNAHVFAGGVEGVKSGLKRRIKQACVANEFLTSEGLSHNWAIVELINELVFTQSIQAGCLNLDYQSARKRLRCVALGYGHGGQGDVSPLKGVVLKGCKADGVDTVGDDEIAMCAEKTNVHGWGQICSGDTGAPLYCFDNCQGQTQMISIGVSKTFAQDEPGACSTIGKSFFTKTITHAGSIAKLINQMSAKRRLRQLAGIPSLFSTPSSGFSCFQAT